MNSRLELGVVEALAEALRPLVAELIADELDRRGSARRVEWLTVEEYAERRRTTPAAVHKRLERGRVAGAVREGRRWLIPDDGVKVRGDSDNEGRAPRERSRPSTER